MRKVLVLLGVMMSICSWGFSAQEAKVDLKSVASDAETLNKKVSQSLTTPADCAPGQELSVAKTLAPSTQMIPPQEILAQVRAGTLTYLGRELMEGSDQNRTCIYRSDKAFILYHNCSANRSESNATDIEVMSFDGHVMSFYIENSVITRPISSLERSEYNGTWRVSYSKGPSISGRASLSQVKDYYKDRVLDYSGGCYTGERFRGQADSAIGRCSGNMREVQHLWKQYSEPFWKDPGQEWITVKRMLREKVRTQRF